MHLVQQISPSILRRVMQTSVGCHLVVTLIWTLLVFMLQQSPSLVLSMISFTPFRNSVEGFVAACTMAMFLTYLFCPIVTLSAASYLPGRKEMPYVVVIEIVLSVIQVASGSQ